MKVDYISRIVITAEHAKKEQRKNLSQIQRKMLVLCCEALQKPGQNHLLDAKKRELKGILHTLTREADPVKKKANIIWRIVSSILKAIANFLGMRVSSQHLDKTLHKNFDSLFTKKETDPIYREIISALMEEPNLDQNQRNVALRIVESLYLLSIHGPETKAVYNPHYFKNKPALNHLKEKTGLIEDKFDSNTTELMQKSLDLLIDRYNAAKDNNTLNEFFENSFNSEDKTLTNLYQRLLGPEDKEWEDQWKANHPAEGADAAAEEVNMPLQNVATVLWKKYEIFVDMQIRKFAEDLQDRSEDPWEQIKERLILNPDFQLFYANDKNFENYLVSQEKILDVVTVEDGQITRDDVRDVIQNYILMEMLGRKPAHQVNPYVREEDEEAVDINYKVPDARKLLAEKRTNKYTEPFKEILDELNKHQPANRFFGNTAKETILAVYKISLYKKELTKYIKNANAGFGGYRFTQDLVGLILHTEHSKKEILGVVNDAPDELLSAYRIYKEKGTLNEFFQVLNTAGGNACLEGRMRAIQDDMAARNYLVDVKDAPPLEPPVVPGTNPKGTKASNLDFFYDLFVEIQLWKYAKDNNMPIDESWRKRWVDQTIDEPKKKILKEEKFKKEYSTKENLLKFLKEEAKLAGQKTVATFEKGDIKNYIDSLDEPVKGIPEYMEAATLEKQAPKDVDAARFEEKGEYRKETKAEIKDRIIVRNEALIKLAKVDEKESIKQNLERFKEYFVEDRALTYAKKQWIMIDKNWLVPETGGKAKILADEEFQKSYLTKDEFKKYLLNSVGIMGKPTAGEGAFTEKDLDTFADDKATDGLVYDPEDEEIPNP